MDILLAELAMGLFGLAVGAVAFFFIFLERRELRKQQAAKKAAHGEAPA
ncbi:MAG TPA: hypothetical protein VN754_14070 [Candidatus Binataceae bacterium]|nr:hypothetical protein [Candidatus Binataceae bacterium]